MSYLVSLSSLVVAVLLYLIIKKYNELEKNQILAANNKTIAPIIIVHIIACVHNGKTSANITTTNKTKNKTPKCNGTVAARSSTNYS